MGDEKKKKSKRPTSRVAKRSRPSDPLDITSLPAEDAKGVDPKGGGGMLPATVKTQCNCVATVTCLGTIGCQAPTMLNCSLTVIC